MRTTLVAVHIQRSATPAGELAGGFDAALLDEIPALAKALRAPTSGGATERSPAATEALQRRNLLHERIGRVRSAAQFVFRARPEIAREVTGTYLRRKRAAARRASAAKTPKVEKPEVR